MKEEGRRMGKGQGGVCGVRCEGEMEYMFKHTGENCMLRMGDGILR